MREKDIEAKVRKYAEELGMLAWKFSSPNRAGVPDRILISASGAVMFMEVKRYGQKATPLQLAMHEELRRHGMKVFVVDCFDEAKRLLDEHSLS